MESNQSLICLLHLKTEDVKYLIRNGKGMATTTNWGDKLTRKVNGVDTKIAKLELIPFENKKPHDAEILEETKQD